MVAPWRYRVTVYSGNIDRLFLPGGDVWRWATDVGFEATEVATAYAPSRTGQLKANHGFTVTPAGRSQTRFTVFNDAEYAKFVHEGTTGPITSSRPGGWLVIAPSPHSFFAKPTRVEQVRGQNANPWMWEATQDVLARHGIH